jgi:two-component system alkaline phosphatase synthesis response regulator PhoP
MSTPLENFLHEIRNCNKQSLTQDEIFEMVARSQENRFISKHDIILDMDNFSIKVGDKQFQRVERLVFQLMAYLIIHEGRTITRDVLLKDIWGEAVVVTRRSIDVAIWKLRQVVGNDRIHTIKKLGYKFEIL